MSASAIQVGDFVRYNTAPMLRENMWHRVREGTSLEGVVEHLEAPEIAFPPGPPVRVDGLWRSRDATKMYANVEGAALYQENGYWRIIADRGWSSVDMRGLERLWPPAEVEP